MDAGCTPEGPGFFGFFFGFAAEVVNEYQLYNNRNHFLGGRSTEFTPTTTFTLPIPETPADLTAAVGTVLSDTGGDME